MDESIFRLDNQIAVITGGGQGLGEAIARLFAMHGACVVVCGRTYEKVAQVADGIRREGGEALAAQVDISQPESVNALHATVRRELGRPVTILVNNAGIIKVEPFMEIGWESWQSILATNLSGAFYCSQVFARDMMEDML